MTSRDEDEIDEFPAAPKSPVIPVSERNGDGFGSLHESATSQSGGAGTGIQSQGQPHAHLPDPVPYSPTKYHVDSQPPSTAERFAEFPAFHPPLSDPDISFDIAPSTSDGGDRHLEPRMADRAAGSSQSRSQSQSLGEAPTNTRHGHPQPDDVSHHGTNRARHEQTPSESQSQSQSESLPHSLPQHPQQDDSAIVPESQDPPSSSLPMTMVRIVTLTRAYPFGTDSRFFDVQPPYIPPSQSPSEPILVESFKVSIVPVLHSDITTVR